MKIEKIEFAAQDNIEAFPKEVDAITDALGIQRGGWYSDRSTISDFSPDEENLIALHNLVGREVKPKEYLWEVARDLANKPATS